MLRWRLQWDWTMRARRVWHRGELQYDSRLLLRARLHGRPLRAIVITAVGAIECSGPTGSITRSGRVEHAAPDDSNYAGLTWPWNCASCSFGTSPRSMAATTLAHTCSTAV